MIHQYDHIDSNIRNMQWTQKVDQIPNAIWQEDGEAVAQKNYEKSANMLMELEMQFSKGKFAAWSNITARVEADIMNKVRMAKDYQKNYLVQNCKWLWTEIKMKATGQGAHSLGITMIDVIENKMSNNDWGNYFKKFTDNRRKMMAMEPDPIKREQAPMNAIFIINARGNNTILNAEIREQLGKTELRCINR